MQRRPATDLETTLERVSEGDRVAFRELYHAAGPRLFNLCARLMRDRDGAQDLLQEVMVRVWEKSPMFDRTKGDAMGWMIVLARNVIFNRLAARPAATLALDDADLASVLAALSREPDPTLAPDLRTCLGKLKEEYRRAVILAYHYGLSYDELAVRLNVPLGTIKTWIHRAIGQLKLCLSQ